MSAKHKPIPQCVCAGGAGALLAHLRECVVEFHMVPVVGAALFYLQEGFLTIINDPVAQQASRAHHRDLSTHAHRISLLLVAELSGKN
jgi:hypothetical protein